MKLIKLNNAVSMYIKPALGTIKEGDKRLMALSVDRKSRSPNVGVAREITKSNKNNPNLLMNIDESKLIAVESYNQLNWKKTHDLNIKGIDKIIKRLSRKNKYFIGLEDPDIWQDEKGTKHIYFTIAFKYKNKAGFEIYLGHAQGRILSNLTATLPVLSPILKKRIRGFKEVAISTPNKKNYRINLTEVQIATKNNNYSAIATTKAKSMSKKWEYLKIALNPKKMKYNWCKGELSSCCFFPKEFLTYKNFLIGIVNGREHKKISHGKKIYGNFYPGLILFDPETGKIPWVSPKPLFKDPDAKGVTFASDFIQTKEHEGILYAHINDSFIRAYKINAKELKKLLPEEI